jgi:hypothetical protein
MLEEDYRLRHELVVPGTKIVLTKSCSVGVTWSVTTKSIFTVDYHRNTVSGKLY